MRMGLLKFKRICVSRGIMGIRNGHAKVLRVAARSPRLCLAHFSKDQSY